MAFDCRILVGMESSGATRRAMRDRGFDAWSCDLLPADDDSPYHIMGNVFDVLSQGWRLAIFHPTCTYLTSSAEWLYKDPDFVRYPGVGYHQQLQPGTKFGADRREARKLALDDVRRIWDADIPHIAIENPVGALSSLWRRPDQTIQPFNFGDDASKRTCLWLKNLPRLRPTGRAPARLVESTGTIGREHRHDWSRSGTLRHRRRALGEPERRRTEQTSPIRRPLEAAVRDLPRRSCCIRAVGAVRSLLGFPA